MNAILGAAVVALAASLIAVIVVVRRGARKLAAGGDGTLLLRPVEEAIVRLRGEYEDRFAALQRQRSLDIEMLDGSSEALVAIDAARRIVMANRRFLELFEDDKARGRPLHDVMRVAAAFEAFDRAIAGAETTARFAVGTPARRIEMRALPVAADGIAAVATFIDVTEIEKLESIRRNFISDFSHEVRTPLAGLRMAVETLEGSDGLPAEDVQQLHRVISRQLGRLERLVEQLSDLSRIESGDIVFTLERLDLERLVADLCEDLADRAAQAGSPLLVSGKAPAVEGDALRIQQALSNLIDNALKYGKRGEPVTIELTEREGFAEVRVTDRGEGISEVEREKVFRRFYRVDRSRSQNVPGTGLGLAITKHIVLQHRGAVHVESEPGRGSTFVVRLPAVSGEHGAGQPNQA